MILQTEEEKLQENLFIITGVFGGVALILCLMILVLSFNLSKYVSQSVSQSQPSLQARRLSKEVRAVKRKGRQAGQPGPEARQPGYSIKRDELPLEPVQPQLHTQRSERGYPDFQEREQPGGKGYNYRGEERTERTNDRSSQYSWEPLPRSSRAGEDTRGPRYSYRR